MSEKNRPMQAENKEELKAKFLEYFRELPLQNLACDYIGRGNDTISRWKSEDAEFAEQISNAKAEWARKNVKRVRSKEWLLERVLRDNFSPRQEFTGKDGKDLPTPLLTGIIHVPGNNSVEKNPTTE